MTVATRTVPGHVRSIPEMDERVFTGFFRDQFPSLVRYAAHFTGQREPAEEIAADAFLKLWERREAYRHPAIMKAFVYTAVRFACLNFTRDKRREAARFRRFSQHLVLSDNPVTQQISTRESCSEIRSLVRGLPHRCRLVVESLFFSGHPTARVAADLALTPGTVRNQKARAFLLIRKKLSDTGVFPVVPDFFFAEL